MIFRNETGDIATGINWTPPSVREDGSAYTADQHKGYTLGVKSGADIVPQVTIPTALDDGHWDFSELNITAEGDYEAYLATVDSNDLQSAWAGPVFFSAEFAAPKPPTGLSVS